MSQPKIALFDIETAPSLGYFWGKLYETNIIKVDKPWYMLCFSYKWLGEKQIHTHSLRDYPGYKRHLDDDEKLVRTIHTLFDEADILIAHNGDGFDTRAVTARFIKHGLKPPRPYRTIDTLKLARKHKFDSNRLNALGEHLGFGGKKVTTGFDLWSKTMAGDNKAWDQIEDYNRRDVDLLEKVYLKLRPFAVTQHQNLSIYHSGAGCPRCQHPGTIKRGLRATNSGIFHVRTCKSCAHCFRAERVEAA